MDRFPQPLRGFLRVLWIPLVAAVPIAVVFGTLDWIGWLGYRIGYVVALFFCYPVALCVWLTTTFLFPARSATSVSGARRRHVWVREILPTTVSAVVGALLGVAIMELLQPGSIGSGLAVAQVVMFTLLFMALALAASFAVSFHRDSVERARTDEELRLARGLQTTLLDRASSTGVPLDIHAEIVSSRQVSGDFYDVVAGPDGSYYIAVADVAGDRMPAAILAAMLLASLRTQLNSRTSVAEIVRELNLLMCRGQITEQSMFVTLFLARFDPRTLQLTYTNAGHRHPLVLRGTGEPERLVEGGTVIGMLESLPYREASLTLRPGDRVVLYTDGVTDAMNPAGEPFGEGRLVAAAIATANANAATSRQSVAGVITQVRAFQAGQAAADDIVIMMLRVPEPGA
ncbi:MAG: PP2C family protein-serine/threonine phosphatase [Candidatus Eisenbacteria bacterium]